MKPKGNEFALLNCLSTVLRKFAANRKRILMKTTINHTTWKSVMLAVTASLLMSGIASAGSTPTPTPTPTPIPVSLPIDSFPTSVPTTTVIT